MFDEAEIASRLQQNLGTPGNLWVAGRVVATL
jgi:hypothetical protein